MTMPPLFATTFRDALNKPKNDWHLDFRFEDISSEPILTRVVWWFSQTLFRHCDEHVMIEFLADVSFVSIEQAGNRIGSTPSRFVYLLNAR